MGFRGGNIQLSKETPFDNSTNGFTATDTQSAIEEVKAAITTTVVTPAGDRTGFYLFDDFICQYANSTVYGHGWTAENASGTLVPEAYTYNNHPGVLRASTSTSTTGRAMLRANSTANTICLGGGDWTIEWCIGDISALSDGTNTYKIWAGLGDNTGEFANGVYFEYAHADSTYWRCKTAASSSRTTTNSTSTVATSTWYRLKIVCDYDSGANRVRFYVNDTLHATHTTNIPTANLQPRCSITKSAGSTARTFAIDYCAIRLSLWTANVR